MILFFVCSDVLIHSILLSFIFAFSSLRLTSLTCHVCPAVSRAWRSPKTMRSAAQLSIYCWLDEEVRLDGVREDGVISNIMDPLGEHCWPVDATQVPPAESISSLASVQTGTDTLSKSLAVSRLSAAILHSRFSNDIPLGNVPLNMRKIVLEKDIR